MIFLKADAPEQYRKRLNNVSSLMIEQDDTQDLIIHYLIPNSSSLSQQSRNQEYCKVISSIETWIGDRFSNIYRCSSPLLLKYIAHINFVTLKSLILVELNITNIEPIAWINMKFVEEINLCGNNAVSLKSLAKINCQKLVSLTLYMKAKIQDNELEHLTRMRQSGKFFKYLYLNCQLPPVNDIITCLFKVESKLVTKAFTTDMKLGSKIQTQFHNKFKKLSQYVIPSSNSCSYLYS